MKDLILSIIPLLCQIESNHNPNAVGDNGRAVGILQIHECVVDDVNGYLAIDFRSSDRRDSRNSQYLCYFYLLRWGRAYQRNTGKNPTKEVLCRIWNGGPKGYLKKSTIPYWNKVKDLLDGNN